MSDFMDLIKNGASVILVPKFFSSFFDFTSETKDFIDEYQSFHAEGFFQAGNNICGYIFSIGLVYIPTLENNLILHL